MNQKRTNTFYSHPKKLPDDAYMADVGIAQRLGTAVVTNAMIKASMEDYCAQYLIKLRDKTHASIDEIGFDLNKKVEIGKMVDHFFEVFLRAIETHDFDGETMSREQRKERILDVFEEVLFDLDDIMDWSEKRIRDTVIMIQERLDESKQIFPVENIVQHNHPGLVRDYPHDLKRYQDALAEYQEQIANYVDELEQEINTPKQQQYVAKVRDFERSLHTFANRGGVFPKYPQQVDGFDPDSRFPIFAQNTKFPESPVVEFSAFIGREMTRSLSSYSIDRWNDIFAEHAQSKGKGGVAPIHRPKALATVESTGAKSKESIIRKIVGRDVELKDIDDTSRCRVVAYDPRFLDRVGAILRNDLHKLAKRGIVESESTNWDGIHASKRGFYGIQAKIGLVVNDRVIPFEVQFNEECQHRGGKAGHALYRILRSVPVGYIPDMTLRDLIGLESDFNYWLEKIKEEHPITSSMIDIMGEEAMKRPIKRFATVDSLELDLPLKEFGDASKSHDGKNGVIRHVEHILSCLTKLNIYLHCSEAVTLDAHPVSSAMYTALFLGHDKVQEILGDDYLKGHFSESRLSTPEERRSLEKEWLPAKLPHLERIMPKLGVDFTKEDMAEAVDILVEDFLAKTRERGEGRGYAGLG